MATDEQEDRGGVPRTLLPIGYRSISPMVGVTAASGVAIVVGLVMWSLTSHTQASAEQMKAIPTPIAQTVNLPDPTPPPFKAVPQKRPEIRIFRPHPSKLASAQQPQPGQSYRAQPVSYQAPQPTYQAQAAPVQPVVDEYAQRLAAARYASSRMPLDTQENASVPVSVAMANSSSIANSSVMRNVSDSGDQHGNFMDSRGGNPGYEEPTSPYELVTGTIIPVRLITAIDSTVPGGLVKAEVIESIFDSRTHSVVVLPQGTIAIGYTDRTQSGEARLVAAWTEFYLPTGRKFYASSNEGAGLKGEAGMPVSVDTHAGRAFGASLVTSVLQAGVGAVGRASSINISTMGNVIQQQQNAPTMHAYPGQLFNIVLNHDLPLDRYTESAE